MIELQLRMTYDPDADAAFIYVQDQITAGEAVQTKVLDHETLNSAVIADFNSGNRLLGIEILGASRLLPHGVLPGAAP